MKLNSTKMNTGRVICFILAFSLVFCCFFGCSKDEDDEKKPTASSQENSDTTESTSGSDSTESTDESSSGTNSDTGSSTKKTTSSKKTTVKTTKKPTATTPPTTKSNTYYAPQIAYNSAPGSAVATANDGSCTLDYSNTSQGYAMVKYSGSYTNVRILVYPPGWSAYINYPLLSRGVFEAIPFTNGNGSYRFQIVGNSDNSGRYNGILDQNVSVSLSYSTVAFSRPNINVNYGSGTSCVKYAAELTRGCDTDISKVQAIYNYVVKNFSYDYDKASKVANTAYIPNLNSVWTSKKGICYDYASTMAAMLRTQGMPTKVEVGNVSNGAYHAWISVYTKESGWVNDLIQFNGSSWKMMDPTFASTGGDRDWSKKYTYTAKYYY